MHENMSDKFQFFPINYLINAIHFCMEAQSGQN